MLSFKEYLLYESEQYEKRKEFLYKKYQRVNIDHEPHSMIDKEPKQIVHLIMSHDPDQKKFSNSDWMINQYHKQNYRQEDLPRVRSQVSKFHEIKGTLPSKDLNKYSLDKDETNKHHLPTHLEPKSSDKEFPDGPRFDHPEATKIHDDGKGTTVHTIDTHAAGKAFRESCGFKPNDDGGVCFGWKNPQHFNGYHEQGTIHVIQTPDNKKWSLHMPSGQMADKNDAMHEPSAVVKHYPSMEGIKLDHRGVELGDDDSTPLAHYMPFLSKIGKKHQIDHDFEAGNQNHIEHHVEHYKDLITPKNTEQAMKHLNNGQLRAASVISLPHITQKHINSMWDGEKRDYGGGHAKDPFTWVHKEHLMHKTNNPDHLQDMYHSDIDSEKRDEVGMTLHKKFDQYPHHNGLENAGPKEKQTTYKSLLQHHSIRERELKSRYAYDKHDTFTSPTIKNRAKKISDIVDWHKHMQDHYSKKLAEV